MTAATLFANDQVASEPSSLKFLEYTSPVRQMMQAAHINGGKMTNPRTIIILTHDDRLYQGTAP